MEAEVFASSRLAAWIMLAAYVAVAAVILPLEINWLKNVEQPDRGKFVTLDVLIQVFILLVLLPPALSLLTNLTGFVILGIGFVGLWVVAIWTTVARYKYVQRYLAQHQDSLKQEFVELEREIQQEEQNVE